MRHKVLSVFLCLLVALAFSSEAWAKAGRGSSLGSRGSRTYDRPIERSVTPPPATTTAPTTTAPSAQPGASQPMYNPGAVRQPGMASAAPAAQPGFFQRNPVMGGMLGGLLGVGIGSMLFGHSPAMAAAADAAPGAAMFGSLIQILLIGGLAYLAFRMFRGRRQQQPNQSGADYGQSNQRESYDPTSAGGGFATRSRRVEKEFEPTADDQNAFSEILMGVQKAWSEGNPVALRRYATPEVVGWMSEDLARDQSRGIRNVMDDVTLIKGDITESWREDKLEYATAMLTFTAKDYVVDAATGKVVEGDPDKPVETTEAWTFARSPGGNWMLSAIEQI